jgi:hypothetical protein
MQYTWQSRNSMSGARGVSGASGSEQNECGAPVILMVVDRARQFVSFVAGWRTERSTRRIGRSFGTGAAAYERDG